MSKISDKLDSLAAADRKALIPYIIAGDPTPESTVPAMHALVANGADIIELGVPFSDPMAEGPVIQLGHERALAHGMSLREVLGLVSEFRRRDSETPVVLMGYANPVVAMGLDEFATLAEQAGVDGVLTVDLPPEESELLKVQLERRNMDAIFLVAPTTKPERVQKIVDGASGYIYYVSLKGVTGASHLDTSEVAEKTRAIKAKTDLPVCVGFGIKDAESASQVAAVADGVVVGSLLVDNIAAATTNAENASERAQIIEATIAQYLKPIADSLQAT